MKFAKELEVKALAKWRDHYIRYKQLKKALKPVEVARAAAATATSQSDPGVLEDARKKLEAAVFESSKKFMFLLQEVSSRVGHC
jgi:SPX domain protein involved in polyphosphate accumulation